MKLRAARIAFILFELIWFNVVLPGHTRGTVTIPCACSAASESACCPRCQADTRSPRAPTPADRAHCALCFFAAHLSTPPALDYSTPRLLFLNYIRSDAATHLIAREVQAPFFGRAPPASA